MLLRHYFYLLKIYFLGRVFILVMTDIEISRYESC